jgi:hypothetical protein
MQHIFDTLLKLEEEREKYKRKLEQHQEVVKHWFDKSSIGNKNFQVGDLVLKWDKANEPNGKHTKFQQIWLSPYQIHEIIRPGTFKLKTLEGDTEGLPING